jgi:hypothetical protein
MAMDTLSLVGDSIHRRIWWSLESHGSTLHAAKELDKLAMWICGAKKIEEGVKDMAELSDSIKGFGFEPRRSPDKQIEAAQARRRWSGWVHPLGVCRVHTLLDSLARACSN